jgi:hypothetical protein
MLIHMDHNTCRRDCGTVIVNNIALNISGPPHFLPLPLMAVARYSSGRPHHEAVFERLRVLLLSNQSPDIARFIDDSKAGHSDTLPIAKCQRVLRSLPTSQRLNVASYMAAVLLTRR